MCKKKYTYHNIYNILAINRRLLVIISSLLEKHEILNKKQEHVFIHTQEKIETKKWRYSLTIKKQAPNITAFIFTSKSIGTK